MSFKLPMPMGGGCKRYLHVHIFIYKYVQKNPCGLDGTGGPEVKGRATPPHPPEAQVRPAELWELCSTASRKRRPSPLT